MKMVFFSIIFSYCFTSYGESPFCHWKKFYTTKNEYLSARNVRAKVGSSAETQDEQNKYAAITELRETQFSGRVDSKIYGDVVRASFRKQLNCPKTTEVKNNCSAEPHANLCNQVICKNFDYFNDTRGKKNLRILKNIFENEVWLYTYMERAEDREARLSVMEKYDLLKDPHEIRELEGYRKSNGNFRAAQLASKNQLTPIEKVELEALYRSYGDYRTAFLATQYFQKALSHPKEIFELKALLATHGDHKYVKSRLALANGEAVSVCDMERLKFIESFIEIDLTLLQSTAQTVEMANPTKSSGIEKIEDSAIKDSSAEAHK